MVRCKDEAAEAANDEDHRNAVTGTVRTVSAVTVDTAQAMASPADGLRAADCLMVAVRATVPVAAAAVAETNSSQSHGRSLRPMRRRRPKHDRPSCTRPTASSAA